MGWLVCQHRVSRSDLIPAASYLDSDISESYGARVRLQTDVAGVWIDTRRIAAGAVGRTAQKPGRLLAVKPHDILLAGDVDLIAVPLLRSEVGVVLIILLTRGGAERSDLIDCSGPSEE